MAHGYDTMMNPSIEELLEETGSKFRLVSLSAMRSREITNYLGAGIGQLLLPLWDPGTFQLFCIASILYSVALVPVLLTSGLLLPPPPPLPEHLEGASLCRPPFGLLPACGPVAPLTQLQGCKRGPLRS